MVMAERSCWRSGTDRRGCAVRSGSARVGRAASDTVGPIAEAWAFELRASSMGGGISTGAGLGCFRGLIADSLLVLLGPLLFIIRSGFFHRLRVLQALRNGQRLPAGLIRLGIDSRVHLGP